MSVFLLPAASGTDAAFRRTNRRRVYNVRDYVRIGTKKAQLLQCFSHVYRNRKYAFLIVQTLTELRDEDNPVVDTVLDLPVYKRQDTQYVYGLPALHHEPLYMIDVPNQPDWPDEPHVLECTWGVAYL